ncbi:DUF6332 family protein [Streptomyces sp. S584]|uniref:DUF6332 family protein n=2 Tax=unclassified Streptomyces TaxID=2593676 RepID=UPI002AFEE05D|nr:DUF6332 family protein [Streptomyces sp. S584]
MSRRTQTERDAMTVEIGYALFSGVMVAAATFAGVSLPALLLPLPDGAEHVLFRAGAALGTLAFALRVVHVLWRFPRAAEERRLPLPPVQPSQPGRTSPDS